MRVIWSVLIWYKNVTSFRRNRICRLQTWCTDLLFMMNPCLKSTASSTTVRRQFYGSCISNMTFRIPSIDLDSGVGRQPQGWLRRWALRDRRAGRQDGGEDGEEEEVLSLRLQLLPNVRFRYSSSSYFSCYFSVIQYFNIVHNGREFLWINY